METIKSYLEAMFANMPNTEAVKKAKRELAQMMEDKYNELIANGSTENEAVGAVISGFGNLDELAEELGLTEEVKEEKENVTGKRHISFDEVSEHIQAKYRHALMLSAGIAFCILSVATVVMTEEVWGLSEGLQIFGFFGTIAIGVLLIVFSNMGLDKWKYLKKEPCFIDKDTINVIVEAKENFKNTRTLLLTVGILLCSLCWLPAAVLSDSAMYNAKVDDLSGALLFMMVAAGVFMIVYSSVIQGTYEFLLKINDKKTIAGEYAQEKSPKYVSNTGKLIMDIYWPTVTCIYFIYSFQTFNWGTSWLIWVIGGIVFRVLASIFVVKKDQKEE